MSARSGDSVLWVLVLLLAVVIVMPLLMMLFLMPLLGMGWWLPGGARSGISPLLGVGMWLLTLVVLVAGGYFVYESVSGTIPSPRDRAIEELWVAYARGELTREEFEERRELLGRRRQGR